MVALVPFQNALLYAGYGAGSRAITAEDNSEAALAIFVGGCGGGVLQSLAASPAELIKVRLQVNAPAVAASAAGPAAAALAPVQVALRSPFQGLGATVIRDGIPHGVWFLTYDVAKRQLKKLGAPDDFAACFGGGIAAAVAWIVGYPADVIKTRVQLSRPEGQPPLSVMGAARDLLEESGGNIAKAYYRGLGLKLARAVPASFVGFGVYEYVCARLNHTRD